MTDASNTASGSGDRYSRGLSLILISPWIILLAAGFLYPVLRLLAGSFFDPDFTLEHYARAFGEPLYLKILLRTLMIALLVTAATFIIGYPLALAMTRLPRLWALTVTACVLVPLWTSILVRSYAWIVLFQRKGLINTVLMETGAIEKPLKLLYTDFAVMVAMTHVLLPFMVLPIFAALKSIPPDLGRAAQNLGAGKVRSFREVTLPLSLPGAAAGILITFILALGFYITPALVGGPNTLMMSTLIGQQTTQLINWPFAGALSTMLLVVTIALAIAFRRVLSRSRGYQNGL